MPDKYVNTAFLQVVESAANTLTYSQLTSLVTQFEKKALLIHRIDWYWTNVDGLTAAADYLQAAITGSNKMTGLSLDDPAVFAMQEWHRADFGTAGSGIYFQAPVPYDFSLLPGGGLLIPARPIFIAAQGESLAAAQTVSARMYYTVLDMKADDYWELVEAIRFVE